MEQQDYLLKQVEQLGIVLRKIFSKLLHLKDSSMLNIKTVNHVFTEDLDFDMEKLIDVENDNWIDALKNEKQFDTENLEKLADILLFAAENTNENQCNQLYEKSLMVYEYIEKQEQTYSFERNLKIDKIKNSMNKVNKFYISYFL